MSEKWMWKGAPVRALRPPAQRPGEEIGLEERAVARRVHVGEVEHGPHPGHARRDREHVIERAEVAHTPHHLDAERYCAVLLLQAQAQHSELLHDAVERIRT